MKRYLSVLTVCMSITAAAACARTNLEEERNALMETDRAWSQTVQDPDQFVAYFADGGSLYPPGRPIVTGRDAIRNLFVEMNKAPGFAIAWTASKADVGAGGDIGYTSGTYEMNIAGTAEKGKYITIWKKQPDGAWKVAEDIMNADQLPQAAAGTHVTMPASALNWSDAPPGLPAGMRSAIVYGDPTQAQAYVLRAQMPANYRIPPHWHPTLENITVLSGTVALGMGDTLDESKMQEVSAGGFASVPAEMRHSFMAKTAATIQVHGIGPFGITYVNPADDPRTSRSN